MNKHIDRYPDYVHHPTRWARCAEYSLVMCFLIGLLVSLSTPVDEPLNERIAALVSYGRIVGLLSLSLWSAAPIFVRPLTFRGVSNQQRFAVLSLILMAGLVWFLQLKDTINGTGPVWEHWLIAVVGLVAWAYYLRLGWKDAAVCHEKMPPLGRGVQETGTSAEQPLSAVDWKQPTGTTFPFAPVERPLSAHDQEQRFKHVKQRVRRWRFAACAATLGLIAVSGLVMLLPDFSALVTRAARPATEPRLDSPWIVVSYDKFADRTTFKTTIEILEANQKVASEISKSFREVFKKIVLTVDLPGELTMANGKTDKVEVSESAVFLADGSRIVTKGGMFRSYIDMGELRTLANARTIEVRAWGDEGVVTDRGQSALRDFASFVLP